MENKELLKQLKDNSIYGYIGSDYYLMNKEQLKDIIMELDGLIFEVTTEYGEQGYDDFKERFIANLQGRWE